MGSVPHEQWLLIAGFYLACYTRQRRQSLSSSNACISSQHSTLMGKPYPDDMINHRLAIILSTLQSSSTIISHNRHWQLFCNANVNSILLYSLNDRNAGGWSDYPHAGIRSPIPADKHNGVTYCNEAQQNSSSASPQVK